MTLFSLYIATHFPNFEDRKDIDSLDLSNKNLEGEAFLRELGFLNLKSINFKNNKLTKVFFADVSKIEFLDISNNEITQFNNSFSDNLVYGEIENNKLTDFFKKQWLKHRWEYYKEVWEDQPSLIIPQVKGIVLNEIKPLDNFINHYDFKKEKDENYNSVVGEHITSMNERSLEQLSQQVVAKALIFQFNLIEDDIELQKQYENKINQLAKKFQGIKEMTFPFPLNLTQKLVLVKLHGQKDLTAEYQKLLKHLETILEIKRSSLLPFFATPPSEEEIKRQVQQLKTKNEIMKSLLDELTTQRKEGFKLLQEAKNALDGEINANAEKVDKIRVLRKEIADKSAKLEENNKNLKRYLEEEAGYQKRVSEVLTEVQKEKTKAEEKEKYIKELKTAMGILDSELAEHIETIKNDKVITKILQENYNELTKEYAKLQANPTIKTITKTQEFNFTDFLKKYKIGSLFIVVFSVLGIGFVFRYIYKILKKN